MSGTARLEKFYNTQNYTKSVPETFAVYKDSTDDITDLMDYMPQEAGIFVDVFQNYHPLNLEESAEENSMDVGSIMSVRAQRGYEELEKVNQILERPENHQTVSSQRDLTARNIQLNDHIDSYGGSGISEDDLFYVIDDIDCAVPMIDDQNIFKYVKYMSDRFKSLGADVVLLMNEGGSERAVRNDIKNLAGKEKHMLDV